MKKNVSLIFLIFLFFLFWPNKTFAFSRTSSNVVSTSVGKPSNDSGIFAADLVNKIRAACPNGLVTRNNDPCLTKIFPSLAQNVFTELTGSANGYYYLQCVGFVEGVVTGITGHILDHGGNAKDFAWNVPTGYTFIKNGLGSMLPGDIPIWNDHGANGHIAYTLEVSGNNFRVANANWDANGVVSFDIFTLKDTTLLGWLRKQ